MVDLATGAVSTMLNEAGSDRLKIERIKHLAVGPDGDLYTAGLWGRDVKRVDPATGVVTDLGSFPYQGVDAFTVDDTHVWMADGANLRRMSLVDGTESVVAGFDGYALVSAGDFLYSVDPDGETLRRWDKTDGSWTVVAGTGVPGFLDGVENDAWFGRVEGSGVRWRVGVDR